MALQRTASSVDDGDLLQQALRSPEAFAETLRAYLDERGWTAVQFSTRTGIPQSTVYSVLSGDRDFRVSTLREIVDFVRSQEPPEEDFIAVVTSRSVLDRLSNRRLDVEGGDRTLELRDYPALSIDKVIAEAVQAERDGASAIVCGPIAATTIQELVDIPVAAIRIDDRGVEDALDTLANRLRTP